MNSFLACVVVFPLQIRGRHGDGLPRLQRQRQLPLVSLPQLRAHRQMELHQLIIQQQHELPPFLIPLSPSYILPSLSCIHILHTVVIPFGRGTVTVDSFFDGGCEL